MHSYIDARIVGENHEQEMTTTLPRTEPGSPIEDVLDRFQTESESKRLRFQHLVVNFSLKAHLFMTGSSKILQRLIRNLNYLRDEEKSECLELEDQMADIEKDFNTIRCLEVSARMSSGSESIPDLSEFAAAGGEVERQFWECKRKLVSVLEEMDRKVKLAAVRKMEKAAQNWEDSL